MSKAKQNRHPPVPGEICAKCGEDHEGKCRAHSTRTGKKCKNQRMVGGFVCRFHGGSTRQARAKAAERVRDLLGEAIDPDRWMREVAAIAYQDLRELFDAEGNLLQMKHWPDSAAVTIASVEVMKRNLVAGDGKQDIVLSPRPWSKEKALEMLGKFHGKLKEKLDVTLTGSVLERLLAGRKRVADAKR